MKKQTEKMKALKLVQDVATHWNSVYYMSDRLISLQDAIGDVLHDEGNTPLPSSGQQWDPLKDLVDVLQLVEVTTAQLSGERYATIFDDTAIC